MPEYSADLYERLRHVERALSVHEASCTEKNKNNDRWQRSTDHDIRTLVGAVTKLKLSDARKAGWMMGAAAVGGLVGTIVGPIIMYFLTGK
jgi:hypothetical protein